MSDRGFQAIGIYDNKFDVNMGTLIRSARLFNCEYVFTVGFRYREQKSAVGHDAHIPVLDFESVADARPTTADTRVVGVVSPEITDPTPTPLEDYHHPERAVYILGAEDKGLPRDARTACDDLVTIPVGDYSMNVACAGTVVLYDRQRTGDGRPDSPPLGLFGGGVADE